MPLQTSGAISLDDIHVEAGGSTGTQCSLADVDIRVLIDANQGDVQDFDDYYGAAREITFTYEIIGAGGAGGYGKSDGSGTGTAPSGGDSVFAGAGISDVTAAGGVGGRNGVLSPTTIAGRDGFASHYGAGGAGGGNNGGGGNAHLDGKDAPATHYGAGGGGGGSDSPGFLDSAGLAGEGGRAGTRKTGTLTITHGTSVTVAIGAGGVNPTPGEQGRDGGDGAGGYAKFTVDGNSTTFTSSGAWIAQ